MSPVIIAMEINGRLEDVLKTSLCYYVWQGLRGIHAIGLTDSGAEVSLL